MLRSATLDTLISNCTHVEQILDLCARALYDRYYPSAFITTGLSSADEAIRSLRINHWTGNQVIGENLIEEQTVTTFVTTIDKAYKNSLTPWLEVGFVGTESDTPNGVFA